MTFLYGVSHFSFSALALSVVLSLFASYFVAMTVVPLFCANLIKGHQADEELESRSAPRAQKKLGRALQRLVQPQFTICSTATRAC